MTASTERETPWGVSRTTDMAVLGAELMSVLTALWYEIDHNGGLSAAAFFTVDAELRFSDAVFRGRVEIDRVYSNRTARGPRVSRHLATNLHLLEVDAARVRAVSTLLLFGQDGQTPRPSTSPALVGDVLDEFELRDGCWLIKSRWIQNQFIKPTTELGVPQESNQ